MTGNPGDAGYDPNTQGVPVNIVAGGSGGGSGGAVSLLSTDPGLVALANTITAAVVAIPGFNGSVTDAVLEATVDQLAHFIAVAQVGSTTVYSGQIGSVAAYGSATTNGAAMTTQTCSEVTIQAPVVNTVTVLFGTSPSTCYMELVAGRDYTIAVSNVNKIFIKSSTSDTTPMVNWIARA
jgi:hypothetical protein